MTSTELPIVAAKDFTTDQPVRWCPGCGDFAVLAQLKQALAESGVPRQQFVFVSGYGCSSRLPYYLNTYGFHTLAGRGVSIATGLKIAQPELSVWVVTGDGDGLGPGLGQLVHALRKNVDIKVLLFNNEILGLSKGQASSASRVGTRTRTTPQGAADLPLRPAPFALAVGSTFVARTADADADHFHDVILRAAKHRGSAFVEVYQNCNVFNDGVFAYATDRSARADTVIELEHGKPLIFGRDRDRAVTLNGITPAVVSLGDDVPLDDIIEHDESAADSTLAEILSKMSFPELPECLGVFRSIERPTFEDVVKSPASSAQPALQDLLVGDDCWTVE